MHVVGPKGAIPAATRAHKSRKHNQSVDKTRVCCEYESQWSIAQTEQDARESLA